MTQPAFVAPIIGCLFLTALAGCETTKPASEPEKPVADATPRAQDLAPQGNRRDAVLWNADGGAGDRVFFAYDSSLLSSDAMRTLQVQASWLKQHPGASLTIEGHSDERGTREYNLALGDRRASAVRDYLVAQGVAAEHLRTLSYGKERPQVAGHDEASWAQNRRGVSVPQ
jgi:peptidoglycan-associated lipoprotein